MSLGLVRSSDFCRPLRRIEERHAVQLIVLSSPPPSPSHAEAFEAEAERPSEPRRSDRSTRRQGHEEPIDHDDRATVVECASAYLPLSLIRRGGFMVGRLAVLEHGGLRLVVRVRRYWEEEGDDGCVSPGEDSSSGVSYTEDRKLGTASEGDDGVVCYVSSMAATNLGLHCGCARATTGYYLLAFCGKILAADEVTLQCWGLPLPPRPLLPDETTTSPSSSFLPLPPEDCLLQRSTVCAIHKSDKIYFFETLHVKSASADGAFSFKNRKAASEIAGDGERDLVVFRTSTRTRYRWVFPDQRKHVCASPRLPCLSTTRSWFACQERRREERPERGNNIPGPHDHPDASRLLGDFLDPLPSTACPSERVLHVVGTERQHHVETAVRAAADLSGRICVVCQGLACYAFNHVRGGGGPVLSGSLLDQLAGLRAAVRTAARHAPSLLFVQDLDQEWSHRDRLLQEDQQERLWETLMQGLRESSTNNNSVNEPSLLEQQGAEQLPQGPWASTAALTTPPILVILSTRKPLPPGSPLQEHLAFDSIRLSQPNEAYLRYLWWSAVTTSCQRSHETVSRDTGAGFRSGKICSALQLLYALQSHQPSEAVAALDKILLGRPAGEIVQLQKELVQNLLHQKDERNARNSEDSTRPCAGDAVADAVDLLQGLSKKRDRERRNAGGGAASASGRIPAVLWEDVGGLDHVRREILDSMELPLRFPHLFASNTRSGLLLYGPPGTGKTLVAKAVATECGLPFISVKGPELLGSYVGESEAAVRAVFAQARQLAAQNQPACGILFFDELDSLAPRRGDERSNSGGASVMDRVVATLFAELDRQETYRGGDDGSRGQVFCMGATNRPDLLDPALLRPGRFDRCVYLGIGTVRERSRILAAQIRKLRLEGGSSKASMEQMADQVVQNLPDNLTGADLSTIAAGALLIATQRLCREVDEQVLVRLKRQGVDQGKHRSDEGGNDSGGSVAQSVRDQVMSSWDEEHLEPVVTLEDLLEAARDVVPSVTANELENYERLHRQFQSS